MKIYINREPVSGPWGGGNKTVTLLHEKCKKEFDVTTDITESDIDLIFCIDPRPNPAGIWYQDFINYRNNINPRVKIIQRVGDVGSHSKPELTQLVKQTIQMSDFIIFPSDWARVYIGYEKKNYCIVPNRSSKVFFKNRSYAKKLLNEKIKIVTHHWSKNKKKGFDVYEALGKFIKENETSLEFTYIGRYPEDSKSEGIDVIRPQPDEKLSEMLPSFDIYMTASIEEAGANHVLEALAAGLPVVYRKGGGSIQEYCSQYGVEYDHSLQSLIEAITSVNKSYDLHKKLAMNYQESLDTSIDAYLDVIKEVSK